MSTNYILSVQAHKHMMKIHHERVCHMTGPVLKVTVVGKDTKRK